MGHLSTLCESLVGLCAREVARVHRSMRPRVRESWSDKGSALSMYSAGDGSSPAFDSLRGGVVWGIMRSLVERGLPRSRS